MQEPKQISRMEDTIAQANELSSAKIEQKKELFDVAEFLIAKMQLNPDCKFSHITIFEGDIPNNPLTIVVTRADAMTTNYVLDSGFDAYSKVMAQEEN